MTLEQLRRAEKSIYKTLAHLENLIRDFDSGKRPPLAKKKSTRRLSEAGRRAISRAAKKRWREYRMMRDLQSWGSNA